VSTNTIAIAAKADANDVYDLAEDMAEKDADLETQIAMATEQLNTNVDTLSTIESGHYVCEDGWGGGVCTEDVRAPRLTCESGIVSVLASGESQYTITAADVPRPTVVDNGPIYGAMTVTLTLAAQNNPEGNTSGEQSWQMTVTPTATVFDFATLVTQNLGADVTVNSAESDPEGDAITYFMYTATDHAGNSETCDIMVHVVDFDECAGEGLGNTCVENAVCENLFDARDDLASGTYQCTCQEGYEGKPYTLCEPEPVLMNCPTSAGEG
jgi:hypothetical protein